MQDNVPPKHSTHEKPQYLIELEELLLTLTSEEADEITEFVSALRANRTPEP